MIGQGLLKPGRGLIAPANKFYHNDKIADQEGDGVHHHRYDPAKARQILTQAGYQWDKDGRLYFPKNHQPKLLP